MTTPTLTNTPDTATSIDHWVISWVSLFGTLFVLGYASEGIISDVFTIAAILTIGLGGIVGYLALTARKNANTDK